VTIILHPDTTDELKFLPVDSGIRLCVEAQSGDTFVFELDDELIGYVIEQLVFYAWNTTFEELFACDIDENPKVTCPDLMDIPF